MRIVSVKDAVVPISSGIANAYIAVSYTHLTLPTILRV